VEGLSGGHAELRSDGQGKAVLDGVGAEPVRVRALAGERESVAWADPRGGSLLLAAAPRREIGGAVRDRTGAPVANARVVLAGEDGEPLAETVTGADGGYRLPDEEDAAAVVVLPPDGGAPAVVRRGDVVVGPGERLRGRLVGAKGGTLEVYAMVPSDRDGLLPLRLSWPVAADGGFSGLLPREAKAWGLFEGLPVRLDAGDVALPAPVPASGRVTRPDGTGAPGAILFFRPLLNGGFHAPLPGLRVRADDDGRFEATGFARVRYSLEVRAPGCAARRIAEVSPAGGPFEVVVRPGFRVEGVVVDTLGLPVPHAQVRAMCLPDCENELPLAESEADDRGRFRLDNLGGAGARIRVAAEGHHATTIDGADGAQPLRVVLQRR
jgi:hypothetical protein